MAQSSVGRERSAVGQSRGVGWRAFRMAVQAGRWAMTGALASVGLGAAEPVLRIADLGTGTIRMEWPVGDGLHALDEATEFVGVGTLWQPSLLLQELDGGEYRVELPAGEATRYFRLRRIFEVPPGPSPDPRGQASLPVPNAATSFAEGTAFLYTGPNPVQVGVAPGTIEARRASVIRGRVRGRDGGAIGGVHVSVLDHPEYGFTRTRADGEFDLVVNGGGRFVLNYQLKGYCPAQRPVESPVEDFRTIEEVVLVAMDPIATPVTFGLGAPLQMAQGSTNSDAAGTRSAKVLFPAGTRASLELPDGTTRESSTLTIRATEFTVGPDGRKAMPGPLPPSSAYTYAVELSADEAVAAGAETIRFNRFVHVYVDNFLGMPPGALIPSGYYDRRRAAWVPQENGVVIRILDAEAGLAKVDIDGDGRAEGPVVLEAAEFTSDELRHLASNYAPGRTLWRMPAMHFTAMDYNCPENPADKDKPNTPGDQGRGGADDTQGGGGDINLSSQVFEETIPLAGIPMGLHYSSARVPGYRVNAGFLLPLTGETLFPNLKQVEAEMDIGGRFTEVEYLPSVNLVHEFSWDGLDAYGRTSSETRTARFLLEYLYPQVYGGHRAISGGGIDTVGYGPPLFGNFGAFQSSIGHNGALESVGIRFERKLTIADHRKLGLGGWSLTPLHRYDPDARTLYRGDGEVLRPDAVLNAIEVEELPTAPPAWVKVEAAPDGSMYLIRQGGSVYRRSRTGVMTHVAGDNRSAHATLVGDRGFHAVDGRLGPELQFDQVQWHDTSMGADGSLYLRSGFEIVRIDREGRVHLVLGNGGALEFPSDGREARKAWCGGAGDSARIAVAPDGTVYFSDRWVLGGVVRVVVRKISPDGLITTLAGLAGSEGAGRFFFGHGKPAIEARTAPVVGLQVGADGALYIAELGISRITRGGMLEQLMNGAATTEAGFPANDREISEGTPAESERPNQPNGQDYVSHLCLGPNGQPYWVYNNQGWIAWTIDGDGLFQRVAGRYLAPYQPGLNPLASSLGHVFDMTLEKDGSITFLCNDSVASSGPRSLRRIGPALPGYEDRDVGIPSTDGRELYVFNEHGMHLATLDTRTWSTNWAFAYDGQNRITEARDAWGGVTRVERDGVGRATAIVGTGGHRTALTLDADGFLSRLVGPSGAESQLGYAAGGLLTSIRGPSGNTFAVEYDSRGRATRVTHPGGGALRVEHVAGAGTAYSTLTTSAVGDVTRRDISLDANGDSRWVATFPDGTVGTQVRPRAGGIVSTRPDGTRVTVKATSESRFPGQTQVPEKVTLNVPGLPTMTLGFEESAVLGASDDPRSMTLWTGVFRVNNEAWTRVYDAGSRRLVTTSPTGRTGRVDLDGKGRVVRQELSGLVARTNGYSGDGRSVTLRDGEGDQRRETRVDFSAAGDLAEVRDAIGRSFRVQYAADGQVSGVQFPDGATIGLEYDAENRLKGVTPPGRPAHRFAYHPAGDLARYTPPTVDVDDSVGYRYDLTRTLVGVDLPDGQKWELLRGPGGRMRQTRLGTGEVIDFGYDAGRGVVTNLTSSTGVRLGLDYRGSIPFRAVWAGPISGEVRVGFTPSLQVASVAVNGASDPMTYDRDGLLVQAGALAIERDAASGQALGRTAGVVSEIRTFNPRGLLATQRVQVSGTNYSEVTWAYDAMDRITNRVEVRPGGTTTLAYRYDAGGRLVEVWKDGALVTSYGYDANGNRTSRNGESSSYDAQDRVRISGATEMGWSRNGYRTTATTAEGVTSYAYDVRGVLLGVSKPGLEVSYVVDPVGRRVGKRTGGVLERGWLWWDDRLIAEVGPDSTVTKRFVYGDDAITPLLMVAGGRTYRLVTDERSSVRWVVDVADGTVAQALEYDEFGRVLVDTNPGFQPFGFCGGQYDASTGLVRMGLRDYDAETGQWMMRDPLLFAGGTGSLYAYVGNEPINRMDPSGAGPWSQLYRIVKGGLGVVSGLGMMIAAGTVASAATPPAILIATFFVLNGTYTTYMNSYNTVNAVIDPASKDLPASIGAAGAYVVGNSPEAQRFGALYDLGLSLGTGPVVGAAQQVMGLSKVTSVVVTTADAVAPIDATASAYGLTPGSTPPMPPARR